MIDSLESCGYCSKMLINLINDLLDHAKMEKNKFQLNNSFFDLGVTIQNSINSLSFFAKQKCITPSLEIDEKI